LIERRSGSRLPAHRWVTGVILSGNLGDHGTTIMVARGDLDLETEIESDSARSTP